MSESADGNQGLDLTKGVALNDLDESEPLFGQVDGDPVLLIRAGDEVRALGAKCTHYGAPLGKGLVANGTVRCPWHHACFSLEDGTVRGGPAFNPLPPYDVEVRDGKAFVGGRRDRDPLAPERPTSSDPESVVIIGAGPAGTTAAETLRREGYDGPITLIDPDPDAPYDRPNLSKAYLSGDAQEEWMPLRSVEFFEEHGIERVFARVTDIDPGGRTVTLESGDEREYGALLLAPGSSPRRLKGPGMDLPHVRTLRSFADCREIIEAAETVTSAVIVGASFIGMEVAASLRARGLSVTVVAPEAVPFEAVLGKKLGTFLQSLHNDNGVTFRLGRTVSEVEVGEVILDDGTTVEGDLVILGVGVRPNTELAERAGLTVDDGIVVDRTLRTSAQGIFAAGDVARYPDARTGRHVRIEHWVVAGRQGRTAARNMLGGLEPFADVPFFWTRHFGTSVAYVGHAESWDRVEEDGQCAEGGCSVGYWKDGRRAALATVGRSQESLETELAMEEEARAPAVEPDWGV